MGVSTGKVKLAELKKKFENIQKELDVPLNAIMATEDDEFRKPNAGMWKYYVENINK